MAPQVVRGASAATARLPLRLKPGMFCLLTACLGSFPARVPRSRSPSLLRIAMVRQLLDVLHEAKELPLPIHFPATA